MSNQVKNPPARVEQFNATEIITARLFKACDQLIQAHPTSEYNEMLDEMHVHFTENTTHDKATIKDFNSRYLALKRFMDTLTDYEIERLYNEI